MATVLPYGGTSDGNAARRIIMNQVQTVLDAKHMLDHLIVLRDSGGGNNWTAVAAAMGAPDAAGGQAVFDAWNTYYANALNAYNAAGPLDQMRPN